MAETICMRIGELDRIDFVDFASAVNNFLGLLKDVDSAVAHRKTGNLTWRLSALRKDPIPIVGVTPFQRRATEDSSRIVEKQVFANIESLTEKGERNKFFSDAALARVRKIASSTPKLGASAIYIDTKKEEPSPSATITVQTLNQVRDLTDVKSTSFGTVMGELGSISIRKGNEFRVWDQDTNSPVRCYFGGEDEERIKQLLRKKVMVTGTINSNRYGIPLSFRQIDAVSPVEPENLPSIEEMAGIVPDFTGGLSLKEFFEEMD